MKQILADKNNSSSMPLYVQLYDSIKKQLFSGEITTGEKLPSVRALADMTGTSTTTIIRAYDQLISEGYIKSRPGSGYFAEAINITEAESNKSTGINVHEPNRPKPTPVVNISDNYLKDPSSFDFVKWKKCLSYVFNEKTDDLLTPSVPKGEYSLRSEIADYLFHSRGVHTSPDNIVIAAGTQQTALQLGRLLRLAGISIVSVENPCYSPVRSMFTDAGFTVFDIPVTSTGILVEKLPINISSAVYVSPSNQFPTGAVMPISARQQLLSWASSGDSYIVEDDYDSELRYFGRPLPTLKALDTDGRVIYLGSFTATLFASIKISYMVLPDALVSLFNNRTDNYKQACSKAEQLALAEYMKRGYYYAAIRKKRILFTKKLSVITKYFEEAHNQAVFLVNAGSGLSVIVRKESGNQADFCRLSEKLGIRITPVTEISGPDKEYYSLYYTDIPLDKLYLVKELIKSGSPKRKAAK